MLKCPKCGAFEQDAFTPRTVYGCDSSDYDQRPGTFDQSRLCKATIQVKELKAANEILRSNLAIDVGFDSVLTEELKRLRPMLHEANSYIQTMLEGPYDQGVTRWMDNYSQWSDEQC